MGKKTTKRKTRWRTLSIGEVPSDTEEDTQDGHQYRSGRPYNGDYHYPNGSVTSKHPYQRNNAQAQYNSRYSNNYSSHSTPTRNRSYQYNGDAKYKSSRSNSTASEPKITFNEDEYTRITTPRQDVLFKKGYLSKKKPLAAEAPGGAATASMDPSGALTSAGGSCGESNPSTGYNSTTGGGTPEHHSQDRGEFYDADIEHHPPFIFHNSFMDHNGVYYVNTGVPGYEPYPMMLVGPGGQLVHPMEFYPPPIAGVPCYPPSNYFPRPKRYSTDSQTESTSPNNEPDSSGTVTHEYSSSIHSSNNGGDSAEIGDESLPPSGKNGEFSASATTTTTNSISTATSTTTIPTSEHNANHNGSTATTITSTAEPSPPEMLNAKFTSDEPNMNGVHPQLLAEHTNGGGLMAANYGPPVFPGPQHFILGPNNVGYIPYPPPGAPLYLNGINIPGSPRLNAGIVDQDKRFKQKRRRRKVSKTQEEKNGATGDSSSDELDSEGSIDEIDNKHATEAHFPAPYFVAAPPGGQFSHYLVHPPPHGGELMSNGIGHPVGYHRTIPRDLPGHHTSADSVESTTSTMSTHTETTSNDNQLDTTSGAEAILPKLTPNEDPPENTTISTEQGDILITAIVKSASNHVNSPPLLNDNEITYAEDTPPCIENGNVVENGHDTSSTKSDEEESKNMNRSLATSEGDLLNGCESASSLIESTPKDADQIESDEPLKLDTSPVITNGYLTEEPATKDKLQGEIDPSVVKLSTIYKVDAEEFVPMALRQTPKPSDETQVCAELRAKFENYLNRQETAKFEPQPQLPQAPTELTVREFVPKHGPPPPHDFQPMGKHNGFVPLVPIPGDFVRNEHTAGTSYPPHKHFGPPHIMSRAQQGYNNHGNYPYKKRQYYDKYSPKNNHRKENYTTRPPVEMPPLEAKPVEEKPVETKPVETKPVEITPKVITNEQTPAVVTAPQIPPPPTKIEKPVKEVKPTPQPTKNTVNLPTPTPTVKKLSNIVSNPPWNRSSQVRKPSKDQDTINKQETLTRPAPKTESPKRVVKTPVKIPGLSVQKTETKNYAQILRKVSAPCETVNVSSETRATKITAAPIVKPEKPTISDPIKHVESEWISVSSRKKGKTKTSARTAFSPTAQDEEFYFHEHAKPAENPPREVIPEVKEVPKPECKVAAIPPPAEPKSVPTPTKDKVKAAQSNTVVKSSSKDQKKTKSVAIKQKPPPVVEKPTAKSLPIDDIPAVHSKARKLKVKPKKLFQTEHSLPTGRNVGVEIAESIDNLRKTANADSKTNVEISQEIDRMIQIGLYANLGANIKSLGHTSDEFMTLLDPKLGVNSKLNTSISNDQTDFNIMETLSQCQKLFAFKNSKDVDVKILPKDQDLLQLKVHETSSERKSLEGSEGKIKKEKKKSKNKLQPVIAAVCTGKDSDEVKEEGNKLEAIVNIPAPTTPEVHEDVFYKDKEVTVGSGINEGDDKVEEIPKQDDSLELIEDVGLEGETPMVTSSADIMILPDLDRSEMDLSENDDTLLSLRFDSFENISVITEEPHLKTHTFTQVEAIEPEPSKESPDPDSWSSHTNVTTTETHSFINTEPTDAGEIKTKSLTEVVKDWLHEAKEKSPDVDILKSPEKISREQSAPPVVDDDDGEESEPEVGKASGSKNVNGNPLFAASANPGSHSFLSKMNETWLESVALNGYSLERDSFASGEPSIGEDALLVNGRVANSAVYDLAEEVTVEEECFEGKNARNITKSLTENVAMIAREIVNTVNPVFDGLDIAGQMAGRGLVAAAASAPEVSTRYEVIANGCRELNRNRGVARLRSCEGKMNVVERHAVNGQQCKYSTAAYRNDVTFSGKGAFVRDIGVIKRTVSESGAIFQDDGVHTPEAEINLLRGVYSNVNKSKSCVDMNLLIVDNERKSETTASSMADSHEDLDLDLLDCWENDLLNNEKPVPNNGKSACGGSAVNIKNNLVGADLDVCNRNAKKTNEYSNQGKGSPEDGEEALEIYESMYGKNLDYLEIKQKALGDSCNEEDATLTANVKMPTLGDGVVPCGAVCCNVM